MWIKSWGDIGVSTSIHIATMRISKCNTSLGQDKKTLNYRKYVPTISAYNPMSHKELDSAFPTVVLAGESHVRIAWWMKGEFPTSVP